MTFDVHIQGDATRVDSVSELRRRLQVTCDLALVMCIVMGTLVMCIVMDTLLMNVGMGALVMCIVMGALVMCIVMIHAGHRTRLWE